MCKVNDVIFVTNRSAIRKSLFLPGLDGFKLGICRDWWRAKSDAEQTQWFRDQAQHGFGQKRDWNAANMEEHSKKEHQQLDHRLNDMIPCNIYVRRKFCEGVQRTDAIVMFNEYVEKNKHLCRYAEGQWHVPDYQGFGQADGTASSSGYQLTRFGDITSSEQMRRMEQEAIARVHDVANSSASANRVVPGVLSDAIPLNIATTGGAEPPKPPAMMSETITREVHCQTGFANIRKKPNKGKQGQNKGKQGLGKQKLGRGGGGLLKLANW